MPSAPFSHLLLATRNPGKVEELRALLDDFPIQLSTTADWPEAPEVVEDADTLAGNARKKALTLHRHASVPALADDTGLEVDALDGRPGVRSARFAGPDADDAANRVHLLRALRGTTERAAQFRTVVAFAEEDAVRCFEGICRGHILEEERGTGGFGYDPLFVPEGYEHTFAELPPDEKNRISHRGRALRVLTDYLSERF